MGKTQDASYPPGFAPEILTQRTHATLLSKKKRTRKQTPGSSTLRLRTFASSASSILCENLQAAPPSGVVTRYKFCRRIRCRRIERGEPNATVAKFFGQITGREKCF